jgi:hypothetical protein
MSVHVLHLADEEPTFNSELATMTVADKKNFPVLNTMSIARITLASGAFREPHWNVAANALRAPAGTKNICPGSMTKMLCWFPVLKIVTRRRPAVQ